MYVLGLIALSSPSVGAEEMAGNRWGPPGEAPLLGPQYVGAGHTVSRWRWRSDDWLVDGRLQGFIGVPTRWRSRSRGRRDNSHSAQWAIIHSGQLPQVRDTAPLQLCETLVQIRKNIEPSSTSRKRRGLMFYVVNLSILFYRVVVFYLFSFKKV